jgi:hypothetical protein
MIMDFNWIIYNFKGMFWNYKILEEKTYMYLEIIIQL